MDDQLREEATLDAANAARIKNQAAFNSSRIDHALSHAIMRDIDALLTNSRTAAMAREDKLLAANTELSRALGDALDELADCKDEITALKAIIAADVPASVADEWGWEE
jgi:hypothetical protein